MAVLLRVSVNGRQFVIAGESSLSVLGAHVSAVGHLGPDSQGTWHPRDQKPRIDLSVGGLTSRGDRRKDEHLRWGKRLQLSAGDVVTIEVLDAGVAERPSSRSPADTRGTHGVAARRKWLNAMHLYFRMRDRFFIQSKKQSMRERRRAASEWRRGL